MLSPSGPIIGNLDKINYAKRRSFWGRLFVRMPRNMHGFFKFPIKSKSKGGDTHGSIK